MWQLENRTPFASERTWTRGRDGAEIWLVVVKCTFDIHPDGSTTITEEQPPVTLVAEYFDPDRPADSSLKYDSDLVRTKATTDVIVLGTAYSPGGEPVTELEVGVRVGTLAKRLRVVGDRSWQAGSSSAPQPFAQMPIVYERAYGGIDGNTRNSRLPQWDSRNPSGTGFATSESALDGVALPNIEYPDQLVRRWKDRPVPAGFGPIAAHWQPRADLTGTYDLQWQQKRFPLVPDDFDDRHYQCAPFDQQARQFLKGGEPVVLSHLTPAGEMRFELPRVFLALESFFSTGERQNHDKPKLHTVIIEPDLSRVALVWHSALRCHPKVYKLMRTRISQKRLISASFESRSQDSRADIK
jgi:hypothetical protein